MNEARLRLNNVFGTLGAIMLLGDTTITFAVAPVNLPTVAAGRYVPLTIEPDTTNEEVVYLTAYTAGATTGTILRGQEGTTAIQHASGSPWLHGPTRYDYWTSPRDRPVPTTWDDEFDGIALDSKWAYVNQKTSLWVPNRGLLTVVKPSQGGATNDWSCIVQTAPTTRPWQFDTGPIAMSMLPNNACLFGIVVRDSTSGRLTFWLLGNNAGTHETAVMHFTDPGTYNAWVNEQSKPDYIQMYLRLQDNGTNHLFSWSLDGVLWTQQYSESRTVWLANGGDQIGLAINAYGGPMNVTTDFFRRTG